MNQARTSIIVKQGTLPGPFNQMCFDRLAWAFPVQAIAAILFVLDARGRPVPIFGLLVVIAVLGMAMFDVIREFLTFLLTW